MSQSITMAGIAAVLFTTAAQTNVQENVPPIIDNTTMAPLPAAPGLRLISDNCDDPGIWEQDLAERGQKSQMKIDSPKAIYEMFVNAATGDWTILKTDKTQPEEGFACKVNEGKNFPMLKPFLDLSVD